MHARLNQLSFENSSKLKLVNYEIFIKLCDRKVGIRNYLNDEVNKKTLYEDIPIENHLIEILKLMSEDTVGKMNSIELQLMRLRLFKQITNHKIGMHLFLQVVDKFKCRFDFIELLTNQSFKQDKDHFQSIFKTFIECLLNSFQVKTNEFYKFIFSFLNFDAIQLNGNSTEILQLGKDKIKTLFSSNEELLNVKVSVVSAVIKRWTKMICSEIGKNKHNFVNLNKKSELISNDAGRASSNICSAKEDGAVVLF